MKCMRLYCEEERWDHPEKGPLVLCREHAEEVFRGERRAPPLRHRIDYSSVGRKTFLVEDLPGMDVKWKCPLPGDEPGLRVRPSKHLEYTQAELDEASTHCAREWGARLAKVEERAKLPPKERMALFFKEINEAPLVPSYGREPERHEKIVHHAMTGQIWVKGYGYMAEADWDDILKWSAENASS